MFAVKGEERPLKRHLLAMLAVLALGGASHPVFCLGLPERWIPLVAGGSWLLAWILGALVFPRVRRFLSSREFPCAALFVLAVYAAAGTLFQGEHGRAWFHGAAFAGALGTFAASMAFRIVDDVESFGLKRAGLQAMRIGVLAIIASGALSQGWSERVGISLRRGDAPTAIPAALDGENASRTVPPGAESVRLLSFQVERGDERLLLVRHVPDGDGGFREAARIPVKQGLNVPLAGGGEARVVQMIGNLAMVSEAVPDESSPSALLVRSDVSGERWVSSGERHPLRVQTSSDASHGRRFALWLEGSAHCGEAAPRDAAGNGFASLPFPDKDSARKRVAGMMESMAAATPLALDESAHAEEESVQAAMDRLWADELVQVDACRRLVRRTDGSGASAEETFAEGMDLGGLALERLLPSARVEWRAKDMSGGSADPAGLRAVVLYLDEGNSRDEAVLPMDGRSAVALLDGGALTLASGGAEVADYKAHLEFVSADGERRNALVDVNHPARTGHWTVHLSAYSPGDEEIATFTAVHDPGTPVAYGGYALTLAGMAASLAAGLLRKKPWRQGNPGEGEAPGQASPAEGGATLS